MDESPKRNWYRRRTVIVGVVIAAFFLPIAFVLIAGAGSRRDAATTQAGIAVTEGPGSVAIEPLPEKERAAVTPA